MLVTKMGNAVMKIMSEEDFEDTVEMSARSFMRLNTLWLKLGASYETVKPYLRNKLLTTINQSLTLILKVDSKVRAVVVAIDLLDYKHL
jgi:hypothetical protein